MACPIVYPGDPGMLLQRGGDGGFRGQTKSEIRNQKAECRGEERAAKASQKAEVRSQEAKLALVWRRGDADFHYGFGVGVVCH